MNVKLPPQSNSAVERAAAERLARLQELPVPGKVTSGPAGAPTSSGVVSGVPERKGPAPQGSSALGKIADVVLDPSKSPDLGSFAKPGANEIVDALHASNSLFGDLKGRARSAAELRDAASSLDVFFADAKGGADRGLDVTVVTVGSGRAVPDSNTRFRDPRSSYEMAGTDGAAPTEPEKKDDKKTDKTLGETISDAWAALTGAAKTVGAKARDFAVDVVLERFGPPIPLATPLTGPAALDEAGGDVKAIGDGMKTFGELAGGDYFGSRLRGQGSHTPTPDGVDAPANSGEAASRSKIGRLIAAMVGAEPKPRLAGDKSGIMIPSEDGANHPRPSRDSFGHYRIDPKGTPRTSGQINPGSGDDGATIVNTGKAGPLPKRDPGFVDPPEILGGTSVNPPSQPGTGTPSGPGSTED